MAHQFPRHKFKRSSVSLSRRTALGRINQREIWNGSICKDRRICIYCICYYDTCITHINYSELNRNKSLILASLFTWKVRSFGMIPGPDRWPLGWKIYENLWTSACWPSHLITISLTMAPLAVSHECLPVSLGHHSATCQAIGVQWSNLDGWHMLALVGTGSSKPASRDC